MIELNKLIEGSDQLSNKKSGIKIILLLMALVLGYLIFTIVNQRITISQLEAKRSEQDAEVELMKSKIKSLEEEIASGGTLKFIERIARDEYGMVKPKEVIFIDKDKEDNPFKNK